MKFANVFIFDKKYSVRIFVIITLAEILVCSASQKDKTIKITGSIYDTKDNTAFKNDSLKSQIYKENRIRIHFKLPLSDFKGKTIKQSVLGISHPKLQSPVYTVINNTTNSCNTDSNETLLYLVVSGKCASSADVNFKTLSISKHIAVSQSNIRHGNCSQKICIEISNLLYRASVCENQLKGEFDVDLITCKTNEHKDLQLSANVSKVELSITYSDPVCDFDERCEWNNQSSNFLTRKPSDDCCDVGEPLFTYRVKTYGNCKNCPMFPKAFVGSSNFSAGQYGAIIPSGNQLTNKFVSPLIFGSSYDCSLHFSVWTEETEELAVSINSVPTGRTVFVKHLFKTPRKKGITIWKRIAINIGKINEIFQVEVQATLSKHYSLAIDDISFTGCQNVKDKDASHKCSEHEYQCSTGLCITKDKLCDLVPDCFYGDDETLDICDTIPVEGKCSFENSLCNWTADTLSSDDCVWKKQKISDMRFLTRSASNATDGQILFVDGDGCYTVPPLRSRQFPAFNSTSGTCKVRFAYHFESRRDSLSVKICYNSSTNCQHLWESVPNTNDQQWTRQVVPLPRVNRSFLLQFEADVVYRYFAIDNIAMTPGCFIKAEIDKDPKIKVLEESNMEVMMTSVGASVGVFMGVVIALTSIMIYKRYRRKFLNKDPYRKVSAHSSATNCSIIEERQHLKDNTSLEQYDSSNGSNRPPSLTYSDIATTVSPYYEWSGSDGESIRNVPRKKIKLMRLLGKGAFGEVYYGLLADVAHIKGELPVAIKTLPTLCSEQTKTEFFFEALILSKFRHPNIVKFLGISVDEKSMFLILELMEGGDVRSFLRDSRPREPENPSNLTLQDLLQLAIDISLGCQYLELNKFIHRDIAARNCLLTERGPKRIAKIGDFGMARDVFRTNYYRKNGIAMIPVKWMPPEAFMDGVFTVKTDVWAFGVVLWEIFTMGFVPYPGRTNAEVMKYVTEGGRLEHPSLCPEPISELITLCWKSKPEDRPSFTNIVETLKTFNQNNQFHNKISLSDLKRKTADPEESTVSCSSTIHYDTVEKSSNSQKTVTADVHILPV